MVRGGLGWLRLAFQLQAYGIPPEPARQNRYMVIAALLLSAPSPVQTQNGYEDYLAAAELAKRSGVPAIYELAMERKESPSHLTLCRRMAEAMGGSIELVRRGNSKAVSDPRKEITSATAFPEFTDFKLMAHGLAMTSHAQFGDGSSSAATDTLLIGLEMADKYGRFTLISGLVGIAHTAILLRSFEDHLNMLSAKDWAKVEALCTSILNSPNAVVQVFQFEALHTERMLINELAKADDISGLVAIDGEEMSAEQRGILARWKRMTPAQRSDFCTRLAGLLRPHNAEIQRRLAGPENGWEMPALPKPGGLEELIIDSLSPVYQSAADAFARNRTQLRLLRLHAAIRQYWFEHMQLPQSFAKLKYREYAMDPLAGSEFVLEPTSRNNYRLYSKGNSRLGEIELVYRRRIEGQPLGLD